MLGAFVLFGAVATAGFLVAYAAVEDYARAKASLGWTSVEGVILSREEGEEGVRYAWFDGDEARTGDRVRFWTGALAASGAVYQPGQRVALRVSPEDGRVAVIEPGGSSALFAIVLAFGAFLVFIGLAGVIRLAMLVDGLRPEGASQDYDFSAVRRV